MRRGQRNNRQQGGKRSWEKEKKKEKKATQEEKRAVADKPQEVSKTTAPPTELPKKSYRCKFAFGYNVGLNFFHSQLCHEEQPCGKAGGRGSCS